MGYLFASSSEYPSNYCAICARSLDYCVLYTRPLYLNHHPALLHFLESHPVGLLCHLCTLAGLFCLTNASSGSPTQSLTAPSGVYLSGYCAIYARSLEYCIL
eukprot:IDg8392t1